MYVPVGVEVHDPSKRVKVSLVVNGKFQTFYRRLCDEKLFVIGTADAPYMMRVCNVTQESAALVVGIDQSDLLDGSLARRTNEGQTIRAGELLVIAWRFNSITAARELSFGNREVAEGSGVIGITTFECLANAAGSPTRTTGPSTLEIGYKSADLLVPIVSKERPAFL